MPKLKVSFNAAGLATSSAGTVFTRTATVAAPVTAPIKINSGTFKLRHVRIYGTATNTYLEFVCGDTVGTTSKMAGSSENAEERTGTLAFTAAGNNHILSKASQTITFTIRGNAFGIYATGASPEYWFEIDYTVLTTPCTAPVTAELSDTVAEGDVTLTASGAAGGVDNAITGYEIESADSPNGSAWGAWAAVKVVAETSGDVATNVPPSPTRGNYRKFRIRTRGAAGLSFYSPWTETINSVKRMTLTAISLDKTTADAGDAIRVDLSPFNASVSHIVTWTFGTRSQVTTVAAGVDYAVFIVPVGWVDQIPDRVSGAASCKVETVIGGVSAGSLTAAFTITCPSYIAPSIGSFTASADPALWGLYLKGLSRAVLSIGGETPGLGSSVLSVSISGGGFTSSANTLTTGLLMTAGSLPFTARVTDTRGRAAVAVVYVLVTDYNAPVITELTAYRADEYGGRDENGTYIAGRVVYAYSKAGGNTASLKLYVDGELVEETALGASAVIYAFELAGPYDPETSSIVRAVISDAAGGVSGTAETVVNTSMKIINIGASRAGGVAFGKISEFEKTVELADGWDLLAGNTNVMDAIGALETGVTNLNDEITRVDGEITALETGKQDVINVLPVANGGTGANTRAGAADVLLFIGNNPITAAANDTVTFWQGKGVCLSYFNIAGALNDQPNQTGYLLNLIPSSGGAGGKQLFLQTGAGAIYYRTTGGSVWDETWTRLLDANNLRIQRGKVNMTATASATTNVVVTFNPPFAAAPAVAATVETTGPNARTVSVYASAANVTIYLYATSAGTNVVNWIAVGV